MFEFFKKKPNFEQDPISASIKASLHKKGILVSGDTGTGLTKVTECLVQEISKNKLNTKIFISGYSFDDYKPLITNKKLKVFKIEEQNLDFNFTALQSPEKSGHWCWHVPNTQKIHLLKRLSKLFLT